MITTVVLCCVFGFVGSSLGFILGTKKRKKDQIRRIPEPPEVSVDELLADFHEEDLLTEEERLRERIVELEKTYLTLSSENCYLKEQVDHYRLVASKANPYVHPLISQQHRMQRRLTEEALRAGGFGFGQSSHGTYSGPISPFPYRRW